MVEVKNVTKRIKSQTILDDVSMTAESGDVIGIVGPSGAGKSTLLRLIAGVEGADTGSLRLLDHLYSYPCNPARTNRPWPTVTLTFQGLCLWPHLTLRENVEMPARSKFGSSGIVRASDEIDLYGIDCVADRFPNQVSGGQRQLFALCRATALRPRVLLLDEVTSALDVEHIRTFRQRLHSICNEGTTIVMVSHSLSLVRRVATSIVFIDGGQVVESGPVAVLGCPKSDRLRRFLVAADELIEESNDRTN